MVLSVLASPFSIVAEATSSAESADARPGAPLATLSGSGTIDDPYQITDATGLQAMTADLTVNYSLTGDVDAGETATWNGGAGFDPIGNRTAPFTGTFDGTGHTISGLAIARDSANFVGLFGVIAADGEVRDVTLSTVSVDGGFGTGGLAGESDGVVTGVTVSGSVTGTNQVGGLVGRVSARTVGTSSATGTVGGTGTTGGLVGWNDGTVHGGSSTESSRRNI